MSDYINRESVLGVVRMLDLGCPKIYRKNVIDAVNSMIGIQVDTGDKLVNIEEVIYKVKNLYPPFPVGADYDLAKDQAISEIKDLQSYESLNKKKKAKWIKSDIPNEDYICSSCGGAAWYYDNEKSVSKSKFCPNCGAEMDVR